MKSFIRPIALAVIQRERDNALLVFEGYDDQEKFYRPLGGGIAFGEPSEQTVRRELKEEVGLELCDVRYLATLENIFTYRGQTGHEIVVLYRARLAETSAHAYDQERLPGMEDSGEPFVARWVPLNHFGPGGSPLYPTGLLGLLTRKGDGRRGKGFCTPRR